MNSVTAFDGKCARPGWHVLRLGMLMMAVTAGAPAVSAQDDDVAGLLTVDVRCFGSNAKEDLGFSIKKLKVTDEVAGAALSRFAADTAQCSPVCAAAAELAVTLAEADRRVGTMKFEVGSPPRNMTRSRTSALGFGP